MDKNKENYNGMRIGIDARLWNQTGVGRYIKNICLNLQKIDSKNEYVLIVLKEDESEIKKHIKNKNWIIISTKIKWHSINEQLRFPGLIKKQNVDLMHFPYIDVPLFYNAPYVITIHDLIYHHFMTGKASTLPIWLYGFKMLSYRIVINNAARRAKKIISVSNSTREEIFDHLLVNKKNVEVIYEASDDFSAKGGSSSGRKPDNDPEFDKYFLFVGNVYPHKNVDNLIKAFKIANEKNDVRLIFVGKEDYFYKRLKKDLSKYIKKNIVIIKEDITDEELAGLYKNALALVRPSFMEGFSLPPLEAMASDCLVIASDIPVHKEILKDAAIYFNPNDFVDLAGKMHYVQNLDKSKKQKKIVEGRGLVKEFSWEKAARETLSIFESSLS